MSKNRVAPAGRTERDFGPEHRHASDVGVDRTRFFDVVGAAVLELKTRLSDQDPALAPTPHLATTATSSQVAADPAFDTIMQSATFDPQYIEAMSGDSLGIEVAEFQSPQQGTEPQNQLLGV